MRGAWIEIRAWAVRCVHERSLPMRGAWIEIAIMARNYAEASRRSPCGERGLKCGRPLAFICRIGRSPCGERGLKSSS